MKKNLTFRCNTDNAELLDTKVFGKYGDPAGYEVRLYCRADGFVFVYGIGGPDSLYPEETIHHFRFAADVFQFFGDTLFPEAEDLAKSRAVSLDELFEGEFDSKFPYLERLFNRSDNDG